MTILCRSDWKIENIQNMDSPFECLRVRITTQNSSFNIAVVYHPPEHDYDANDLIDFLTDSSEQLLSENPNAKIIITGDLNKLNIYNLLNQLSFAQLEKSPTRIGPILFSTMVNDIKAIDSKNEHCKFADAITVGAPGYENNDTGTAEVENIKLWSENNRLASNMNKT